jgi:hypothetical protein
MTADAPDSPEQVPIPRLPVETPAPLSPGDPLAAKLRGFGPLGILTMLGVVPIPSRIIERAPRMTHASGTFEVKLTPQAADDKAGDSTPGRLTIEKQFHGDLEAASKGQMLTAGTDVAGSAGYVAIERIIGTLHGRSGSFVLQHSGTMTRGTPQLTVTVVPDSGTGELVGLSGRMTIEIADGNHSYTFEYTLSEPPEDPPLQ